MARLRTLSGLEGPSWTAKALAAGLSDKSGGPGSFKKECVDVVGNFNRPNPLTLEYAAPCAAWISGKIGNWWETSNIRHGSAMSIHGQAGFGNDYAPTESIDISVAKGLAYSNPNRPETDLPLFVFELRDIPKMLKEWGHVLSRKPSFSGGKNLKELPRATASRYLEYQFGIAPFISDLQKILDFQGAVDRKMTVLNDLERPGGTKRSATVYSQSTFKSATSWSYATGMYQEFRRIALRQKVDRRRWTSTRWKPVTPLPRTADDRRWLATRLAFGLDISFDTLWNAMPWSWLIDWFSNVGDIMSLTRNAVPVTHHDTCLMSSITYSHEVQDMSIPSGSTIQIKLANPYWTRKARVVIGDGLPNFSFNVPLLSGTQTAILSSLLVLKRHL